MLHFPDIYIFFEDAGPVAINRGTHSREDPPSGSNIPTSGAEWVELLVSEVSKASNIEDAKARVSHALEALEKSICANATSEAAQSFHKVCCFILLTADFLYSIPYLILIAVNLIILLLSDHGSSVRTQFFPKVEAPIFSSIH